MFSCVPAAAFIPVQVHFFKPLPLNWEASFKLLSLHSLQLLTSLMCHSRQKSAWFRLWRLNQNGYSQLFMGLSADQGSVHQWRHGWMWPKLTSVLQDIFPALHQPLMCNSQGVLQMVLVFIVETLKSRQQLSEIKKEKNQYNQDLKRFYYKFKGGKCWLNKVVLVDLNTLSAAE